MPEKLGYSWTIKSYKDQTLEIELLFDNPIYVSVEEEPELLQILIKDGSLFLSEEGLPLDLTTKARRLSSEDTFSRYLTSAVSEGLLFEKKIPK